MTKRELVVMVAERLGFTQSEVSDVVQATLDAITNTLVSGDRIEIRNFGVFEVKVRGARVGRNPRSGEEVPIDEKRVPLFKAGKALKERVQQTEPKTSDQSGSTDPGASPSFQPPSSTM